MFKDVLGLLKLSAFVVGGAVVAPVAISTGHGLALLVVLVLYVVYRQIFGKDDADEMWEEQQKNLANRNRSSRRR